MTLITLIFIRLGTNPGYLNKQMLKWTLLTNHTLLQPLNWIVLDVSDVLITHTKSSFISFWKINLEKSQNVCFFMIIMHHTIGSAFSV